MPRFTRAARTPARSAFVAAERAAKGEFTAALQN
jgi:hypothetical protein